jgi:hypothetical protein
MPHVDCRLAQVRIATNAAARNRQVLRSWSGVTQNIPRKQIAARQHIEAGPAMNNTPFRSVAPILAVADVDAAIAYYTAVLDFQLGWKWGTPTAVASVCRDGVELMLEAAWTNTMPASLRPAPGSRCRSLSARTA